MRLLITIPVYNERQYVKRTLEKVRGFHPEILVVDDGSTDGTQDILAQTEWINLIRHPENQGYGQSLIDAFCYAECHGYDWVVTMDCDEQHEPERIPDFIRQIRTDKWDLISGSRYRQARANDDLPPGDRRAINATITQALNDLFGMGLTDAFCGFKAHRVNETRRLGLTEKGYAFPLQLWPRVARAGLRVTEIPVRLIYNDPNRHFGGKLDDAEFRLKHYLEVLRREVRGEAGEPGEGAEASPAVCGCCGD